MSYFLERQAAARYDEWLERPFQDAEADEIPDDMTDEEYEAMCDRLDYEEGMREMAEEAAAEARREARAEYMMEERRLRGADW